MAIPRLRPTRRRLVVLAAVVLLGLGAWFLVSRDDGDGGGSEEAGQEAEPRAGPISNDPIVRKLSTAGQVDQILLLGFEGTGPDAPLVAELSKRQLGGVFVRGENWAGGGAGEALIAALARAGRAEGRIPPLITAAQEGGEFRSFPDLPPADRALTLGEDGSPERARAWGAATARALADAGFDLNLFPVADVATLDSPLAGRAFSDDPREVTSLTKAALQGCDDAGLACAPAHFPGLGAASQDTADGPATVSLDPGTLTVRDLEPFRAAVAAKAPAVVVSLALYPAFDEVVPAALAPGIASDLLRGMLGFRGAAISDDLSAGAITATYRVPDAAVQALRAGIDMIQISSPADQDRVAGALVEAVKSGAVPAQRLAQAAERVIDLKRRAGLVD